MFLIKHSYITRFLKNDELIDFYLYPVITSMLIKHKKIYKYEYIKNYYFYLLVVCVCLCIVFLIVNKKKF